MASLLWRILRTYFVLLVACAVVVTSPLQSAPYAAIVMDARTGEVLYEKNANTRLHPASLTKMMTLYIVFQEIEAGNLSLDTKVTISDYAAAQPPSRLGLKPGQKIAIRYLIRAAAVKSANDAASALGDAISGDHVAFAKRMTRTARQLGMDNTTFRNANGLTADGHLSTAHDMNVLGRHLFYDFPQYYNIFSRRTADAGVATVTNTNSRFLDGYKGADGIKTGYTSAAGFNLTASAQRGDKHIIATVFGGTSTANRTAKMTELMDIGFGEARSNVTEQPPVAAPLPDDALIASLENDIDEIDAIGGAGKTIRVSGEVKRSPLPKPRPTLPIVSDEVAIAMAAGIDGALAEATAEPAAEGTLEFQAAEMVVEMAAGSPPADVPPVAADDTALAAAVVPKAVVPDETLSAAAEPPEDVAASVWPPGTLDAQVMALAAVPPEEAPALPAGGEPDLAGLKPKASPASVAEPAPETALAAVAPEPELVVTDPGPVLAEAETSAPPLAEITDVETVAGDVNAGAPAVEIAAATVTAPLPKRAAPIFETVEAAEPATGAEPEVVVVMSTSGGRHFGVNVGEYPSRYEAERALLKTALAESATLNEGLRKTSQSDGSWRASFMGLTEEQAELACRRLLCDLRQQAVAAGRELVIFARTIGAEARCNLL